MTLAFPPPAPALLEVRNVTKHYSGGIRALDDVSFSVKEGEFIAMIGPSGAGKSTLIRCINRMIEVTSGKICFESVPVGNLRRRELKGLRRKIGMIFQHDQLVERLSVIENVLHGRLGSKSTWAGVVGRYSREEKQQAYAIIAMLGLADQVNQRCDLLSGGQKQRVGIARALMQNPRMILCDEPIASLDPNSAKVIMDQLKHFSREFKITLIVNLHQVDVALKYADRILGINKGRLVFEGRPSELSTERISKIYGTESGDGIVDPEARYAI